MRRKLVILALFVAVSSIAFAQSFSISKFNGTQPSNQSVIYALPQTALNVTIELTKTTLKRGMYAEYAEKYLGIKNAPFGDDERWTIDDIKLVPVNEPDPDHYYSLTFKTVPENLQSLFSMNQRGILLELSSDWKKNYLAVSNTERNDISDPYIIDDLLKEKVDTLYKTVVTDSTVTRIPVFKKQIQAKTFEEMAKEAAHELIKTRKRHIKLVRGEYEHQPDGAALRIMIDEMMKLEQFYLSQFLGEKKQEKLTHTFVVYPTNDLTPQKLGSFSAKEGIDAQSSSSENIISVQFSRDNGTDAPGITPDKGQNVLYFRTPAMLKVSLFVDQTERMQTRIPFYQFGSIQSIALKSGK
ncbi:MAG TPA: DUF4831 family protein [Bacteroidales bacterium]|nr:DUF4831 family protein [Bacteroidales bacterium]